MKTKTYIISAEVFGGVDIEEMESFDGVVEEHTGKSCPVQYVFGRFILAMPEDTPDNKVKKACKVLEAEIEQVWTAGQDFGGMIEIDLFDDAEKKTVTVQMNEGQMVQALAWLPDEMREARRKAAITAHAFDPSEMHLFDDDRGVMGGEYEIRAIRAGEHLWDEAAALQRFEMV